MPKSIADRIRLAYKEEVTYGTAVTGANYQELRTTSESLKQDTTFKNSAELRDDRQVAEVARTSVAASGDINGEVSYGTYDDLLSASLGSAAWSSPVTVGPIATIDAAASVGNTCIISDSGSGFGSINQYEWVKVSGFAAAVNNGIFKVSAASSASITVYNASATLEAAGASVTIVQGAQIVNGTSLRSFTIEREYTDLTSELVQFVGQVINELGLNVTADDFITARFGMLGKNGASVTSSSGSGLDVATTTNVVNAVDHVLSVYENYGVYGVQNVSLSLTNNIRPRQEVATLGPESYAYGKVNVTGTHRAYYEDKTVLDKYLAATDSALAFVIQDGAGNGYAIDLPRVKYTSGQRPPSGENTDIIADLNYEAFRNSDEDVTIRIVRFAA